MSHVKCAFLRINILLAAVILFGTDISKADLTIHFLDVGQGDAAIIQCDGEAMMIDGGPSAASSFVYSYLRNTLKLTLLDYMIATHPHEDHIGGLAGALNAVPVDLILSPITNGDTPPFQALKKYADLQGTPIVVPYEGDQFRLGDAMVYVLHCWPDAWSINDMSIVVRIVYGDTSFMFTGDAEYMSEYMMIDSGMDLKSDVLKVGHHGSSSSSTAEFLQAVSPEYAVISCGKDNDYKHPRPEPLETLKGMQIELFRTDMQGTIICHSDGQSITFETEKKTDEDLFKSPYEEESDLE